MKIKYERELRDEELYELYYAMIFFHILILHPAVLMYDFHISITSSSSFHGFITNPFNDQFPLGL